MEEQNQVDDAADSSADAGALGGESDTQGSQVPSSEDGATGTEEPSVADLQKQLAEVNERLADREKRWNEDYRRKESELNQLQSKLEPYERSARMAEEEVDRANQAFHDRAAKIGYPAAIAELTAQQQAQVAQQMARQQIVNQAKEKFIAAGKMPSDFEQFYNSRYWNSKEAFMHDVDVHLKDEHVTKVTEKSKDALARELDADARRKAANKQPKSGGDPSVSGKSDHPGQAVLDGMSNAARRIAAASSEL